MIQDSLEQLAVAHIPESVLRRYLEAAMARPLNQYGIGIDWLTREHRLKPPERARYCIAIFQWRGERWHRVRKISGPRVLKDIQIDVRRQAERLGYPIITSA